MRADIAAIIPRVEPTPMQVYRRECGVYCHTHVYALINAIREAETDLAAKDRYIDALEAELHTARQRDAHNLTAIVAGIGSLQ
jgi:hypothetical protein